jgi:heme/copper-type cytochrome/quinol oxidase subunit 4
MNEPSVLDYVKSIFKSWNSFGNFLEALFQRRDTTLLVETEAAAVQPATPSRVPSLELRKVPWLTLLVLVLALMGQKTFEPPQQLYSVGILLYISALGIALLAFRRGEWSLTPIPADETRADTFSVRGVEFVLSLILGAFAFLMMTGNLFTAANLTLWAGAIIFHLRAFWVWEPRSISLPRVNLKEFFTRNEWTFRITRWGLLIFMVVAVTIFFRTYRLDTVAPEMTSDHAEKLEDVYDITRGIYSIYFPRNTGREPLYIYLCAFVSQWFGISFITLKIVAVFGGLLTLLFVYLLGRELGSTRIGLLAVAFAGIGYWPTVIERFGLRISFYPLFAAATLYYFFRGMRRQKRNDFILAGVALGLGLNGYTPFRIMPFALIALFIIYFLHLRDTQSRKQALVWFGLLAFTSWIFVIPMVRYALERPDIFVERAFSRVGTLERPFPAPVWQLFLFNLWTALKQFNWNDGNTWVHSIPGRPALDVISGALFLIGATLLAVRYIRNRHWRDIMILLAVPLLQMPSILSLAFPEENPTLSRTGGALVPVFLLVGFGLDSLLNGFGGGEGSGQRSGENEGGTHSPGLIGSLFPVLLVLGLFAASFMQNYDLIFNQYYNQYRKSSWNSRDMGSVMRDFMNKGGSADQVRIIPYPYWVDTRLPPLWAGVPGRDIAIAPDNIESTVAIPGAKLFMFQPQDDATSQLLKGLYPNGTLTIFESFAKDHDFYVFRVPAAP